MIWALKILGRLEIWQNTLYFIKNLLQMTLKNLK